MGLVAALCPCCAGKLELPEGQDRCYCTYCGTQIITEAAVAFAKVRIEGTVKVKSVDFVIEAGELKRYHGESADPVVPDEVTIIGFKAFEGSSISSVTIPSSVHTIKDRAFAGCSQLVKVNLSAGLQKIWEAAFESCIQLRSIDLPDTVDFIGRNAFSNCWGLETARLPRGVRNVHLSTFLNCERLREIVLPEGLESIDDYAFMGCHGLERVVFASKPKSLGSMVFANCGKLSVVEGFQGELTSVFEGTPYAAAVWSEKGLCPNCGGTFKGVFKPVCARCGAVKQ